MVPKAGLEPARLAPHAPQTCVSAIPPLRHSAGYCNEACHRILGALTAATTWNVRHRLSLTLAFSQASITHSALKPPSQHVRG